MERFVLEKTLYKEGEVIERQRETFKYEGEAINTYFEEVLKCRETYPKYEAWEENSLAKGLLTWWFFEVGGFESLTLQVDLYKERRRRAIKAE